MPPLSRSRAATKRTVQMCDSECVRGMCEQQTHVRMHTHTHTHIHTHTHTCIHKNGTHILYMAIPKHVCIHTLSVKYEDTLYRALTRVAFSYDRMGCSRGSPRIATLRPEQVRSPAFT